MGFMPILMYNLYYFSNLVVMSMPGGMNTFLAPLYACFMPLLFFCACLNINIEESSFISNYVFSFLPVYAYSSYYNGSRHFKNEFFIHY